MRVEEQAIANADYESFLESCSDMDRQICVLLMQKYTQNEIAEVLGTTKAIFKYISQLYAYGLKWAKAEYQKSSVALDPHYRKNYSYMLLNQLIKKIPLNII